MDVAISKDVAPVIKDSMDLRRWGKTEKSKSGDYLLVISDYFKKIEQLLSNSRFIVDKAVDFKEFSSDEGMVRGRLLFLGG